MNIDWGKPLRIKGHDNQEHEVFVCDSGTTFLQGGGTINRILICHIDSWQFKWVASPKGEGRLGIMPRVYNAKRKPKSGEWWLCEIGGDEGVFYFAGNGWIDSYGNMVEMKITPLYPLIKDPSFEE